MRIKRSFFNGTFKPVIKLTNEELERAFRIKEREYLMQDIEEAVQNLYENEEIKELEYLAVIDNRKAYRRIADMYDSKCDCNVSFNDTMTQAIKEVLREGVDFE